MISGSLIEYVGHHCYWFLTFWYQALVILQPIIIRMILVLRF
jgi:hypothetical protein